MSFARPTHLPVKNMKWPRQTVPEQSSFATLGIVSIRAALPCPVKKTGPTCAGRDSMSQEPGPATVWQGSVHHPPLSVFIGVTIGVTSRGVGPGND